MIGHDKVSIAAKVKNSKKYWAPNSGFVHRIWLKEFFQTFQDNGLQKGNYIFNSGYFGKDPIGS